MRGLKPSNEQGVPRRFAGWMLLVAVLAFVSWAAPLSAADRQIARVVEKSDPNRRVALVVGNSKYRTQGLANAVNDAKAMKEVLEKLGFKVILLTDAGRTETVRALDEFRTQLHGAGVGLFYFAGHGVQMGGQNYLVPVDADMGSETQVKFNTILLEDVLGTFAKAGTPVNIVILDACRNNPFERSRGGEGGLAAVLNAPAGTLIAYSTAPGRVAADGKEGANGLYTSRLLRAMLEPGIGIEDVFKQTRAQVAEASKGAQVPWESTSLTGRLVLKPGKGGGEQVAAVAPAEGASRALAPTARPSSLAAQAEFRDCALCPLMVVVPPGKFQMGSPPGEPQRQGNEGPQREVVVPRPIAVGKFEVTFDEWEACLLDRDGCDRWPAPNLGREARGRRPVVDVSWEDATRYVAWLSRRTGQSYRLLSEAEWEYAARAGTTSARHWGDDIGQGKARCKGCGPAAAEGAAIVGSAGTNPWGLADMLGNAWEWVADCYNPSLKDAPGDGTAWRTGDCARPVLRGGSWTTDPKGVRAAVRAPYPANRQDTNIGFRVATSID